MISPRSSGSMLTARAVEPTRSENITVTWRRSAVSAGGLEGAAASAGPIGSAPETSALMAIRSLIRAPSGRPISRR